MALLVIAIACTRLPPRGTSRPTPTTGDQTTTASPSPVVPDEPALTSVGRFDEPVYMTSPPSSDRLFIVEKTGRIKIVAQGVVRDAPYLDLSGSVSRGSEQGLLSMAFSPDYPTSGLFYVDYTDKRGDTRVVEYRVSSDPDRADARTAREILFVDQPFANHNGGLLLFDPTGMLIVGLGDGGAGGDPGNRAQNLGTLLGKLLRIDPRKPSGGRPYGIPKDNPFVGRSGAREEIWSYGLRNPWRFSFADDGSLYLADVGQNRFEEIDFVPRSKIFGANFGWRVYEGDARFTPERLDVDSTVRPVVVYSHDGGACSVTGGYVYRGEVRSLQGYYLYGDYCAGFVRGFKHAGGRADSKDFPALSTPSLSSFGEDASGQLYLTSLDGGIFRITPR